MARVGMDLDDVIYDFTEAFRQFLIHTPKWSSRTDATKFTEPTRWEFYLDWGLTVEEFIEACNDGVDDNFIFTVGAPMDDAAAQLLRLREAGHTVHIITDRSFGEIGHAQYLTRNWLSRNGIEYDSLTFSADKTVVPVDTMLDDKPANVRALEDAGVHAVLRDRPHNAGQHLGWHSGSLAGYVDSVLRMYGESAPEQTATVETLAGQEVRVVSSTGGEKGQKTARFDLIPTGPLWKLAELYGEGAKKYADRNWESGYDWSLSFAALMRHAQQFWAGEDFDPQPPHAPHMAAVAFHAFALLQFMETQRQFDNRPQPSLSSDASEGYEAAA